MNNTLNVKPKLSLSKQFENLKGLQGLASQQFGEEYVQPMDVKATAVSPITVDNTLFTKQLMPDLPKEEPLVVPDTGLAKSMLAGGEAPKNANKYATMWKNLYNTAEGKGTEEEFINNLNRLKGKAPKEHEIWASINQTMPAFEGELGSRKLAPDEMKKLLYSTAVHESLGGQYNRQLGDGPARSWWQIEPATAYDNIQNYGHALGKGYEKAVGYSAEKLKSMDQKQVGDLLEKDPNFAASMAALWYLRRLPKS